MIRHGARTSMHSLPGIRPLLVSCQIEDPYRNVSRILNNIKETWIRKNPKFGFESWQLYPSNNNCKGSDLTPLGMQQHIITGKYLGWKYRQNLNLTKLHIRSTYVSRTYQSAVAVLLGMLTHKELENARIFRSGQLSFCSQALFSQSCECPGADKLLETASKETDQFERRDQNKQKLITEVSRILGTQISDDVLAYFLIDVFMTFACHTISLPCVEHCFSHSHLEMIWEVQDKLGKNMVFKNQNFIKYVHLYLHPLLTEISNRMTNFIRKKQKIESFVLYSGHDITITPLAVVFGIHDGKWPPFASRIVIELYKKIESKFHYFIKVLYNGKDVTSDVSFCKNKILKRFCKLKYFLDFVKNHLRDVGLVSYENACFV